MKDLNFKSNIESLEIAIKSLRRQFKKGEIDFDSLLSVIKNLEVNRDNLETKQLIVDSYKPIYDYRTNL